MNVTVINPDSPFDSPAYDGEATDAHKRLSPGVYDCDYADEMWGKLVVTADASYLVPGKTAGELVVGDIIDFSIDDANNLITGRVESTYRAPLSEHGGISLTIRMPDGTLHRRNWARFEAVAMAVDTAAPAEVSEEPAAEATTTVVAEEAPIGVLLWPVRAPEFAPSYTLMRVETVRTADRHIVRWIYESGQERTFDAGERVAVKMVATI